VALKSEASLATAFSRLARSSSLSAEAEVILSSSELGIQTGTLQFAGNAVVTTNGEQLTLTLNNATVIAKSNVGVTTNLLDLLVQSPNIIAGGSVTDAVVGQELDIGVGTVSFKLDEVFTITGSSVQIATGQVTIELPTIVQATGSSVSLQSGTVTVTVVADKDPLKTIILFLPASST